MSYSPSATDGHGYSRRFSEQAGHSSLVRDMNPKLAVLLFLLFAGFAVTTLAAPRPCSYVAMLRTLGSARAPRAGFGALAKTHFALKRVHAGEGAGISTRGACATQIFPHALGASVCRSARFHFHSSTAEEAGDDEDREERDGHATDLADEQTANVDKNGVGIQGYDPVAFFTDGKPVLGKEEFHATYHDA